MRGDMSKRPRFIVVAFRYGTTENVFPIGVFTSERKARDAARDHHVYRGGKYSHRIYEFTSDHWDDDVGMNSIEKPCIEDGGVVFRIQNSKP